jgi:hypothetical protein
MRAGAFCYRQFSIYNHPGQRLVVMADGEQTAGWQQVRWELEGMPSDNHFYRITVGTQSSTGKIVLK